MKRPRYTWDPTAEARATRPHALDAAGERACWTWFPDMKGPVFLGRRPQGACRACWSCGTRKGFRARASRAGRVSVDARAVDGVPSLAVHVQGWAAYWRSIADRYERDAAESAPAHAADLRAKGAKYARWATHLDGPGVRKAIRARTVAAQAALAAWLARTDAGIVAGQQVHAMIHGSFAGSYPSPVT